MKIKRPSGAAERLETGHVLEVLKLYPSDIALAVGTDISGDEGPSGIIRSVAFHPSYGGPEGVPAALFNQNWRLMTNISTDPIEGEDALQVNLKGKPIVNIPNHPAVIEATQYLAFYVEVHGCPPPYLAVFGDMRAAYVRNEDGSGVNMGLYWLLDAIDSLDESEALAFRVEFPWQI